MVCCRKYTAEIKTIKQEAAEVKAKELAALTKSKDAERVNAVVEVREREQELAKERLEKVKRDCQAAMEREYRKVVEHIVEIESLKMQIESIEKKKERISQFLATTREKFQEFINRMKKFDAGQSDYMLPPAYIEEIERGLQIAV